MTFTLAALAAACGLARLAIFVALHAVKNEYSPVRHAVSDYAVGSTRRLSSIMTWITVPFWGLLAAAVATGLNDWPDATGIAVALSALAVIFLVLPFVPTDVEGEKATTIGRLHYLLAIAWFAISYACMGNFTRLFSDLGPEWLAATLTVLSWIAAVSLAVSVIALVVKKLRARVFGLSERVFILSVNLFYLGVAVGLLLLG
ncbi:MAG: hypothetical protein BGN97_17075 [Microbacterium sp. 69-10]|uniref:DUF998 domain-containing protein n=1 Tax=Microbacterium sp. 69-10 TaxID=1895783 RepID=UPI0009679174|nr:DUF998 domain-containing protein [Microbacterium sp. 69-10]OJU41074.1 MAG: hypothetical protein BGN97_17075 [Microbacterium sp. 69-10]